MLLPTARVTVGIFLVMSFAVGVVAGQGRGGQGPGRGGFVQAPRDATDQAAVGTGSISGTVTTEGTGLPVRRARVSLSAPELRGTRATLTDDEGRFTFPVLPAGRYTLTASKAGFVNIAYGAKRAGRPGTAIQLQEGAKLERLNISMPRGGVLTGIVVDEHGEPAANVPVRALRAVMQTGERTWQMANQDTTDDRGIYRIFQLQPGEYVVNAMPRNTTPGDDLRMVLSTELANATMVVPDQGNVFSAAVPVEIGARVVELQQQIESLQRQGGNAYAPVYFPGTATVDAAQPITLTAGEERSGLDFRLQLVPTTRVNGIVTSATGALPPATQVMLAPARRDGPGDGMGINVTRVDAQGHFSLTGVVPGNYILQARAGGAGPGRGRGAEAAPPEILWASAEVVVTGQPLPDIVLTLQSGMTVSGRVEFEGAGRATFDPSGLRVALNSRGNVGLQIGGGSSVATVNSDGSFRVAGLAPGHYALAPMAGGRGGPGGRGGAALPPGTVAKSAMLQGRDLLDFPLDITPNAGVSGVVITYTDRTQELSGTIQDTAGGATSDFTIIVFPSDRRYWLPQSRRISAARPGTDGRFTFSTLPAGDYRLTAVTDVENGEWFDPAFLEQLEPASIPIPLREGERKVQDIRLAGN